MTAAFVLDHTALGALGTGSRQLSKLVSEAHGHVDIHLYVPAVCLMGAEASRPGLADHIGLLPALRVVELDYPAAASAGRLVRDGIDWRAAHAVCVGRPTLDWPTGRPVVTLEPKGYDGFGVGVVPVR